MLQKKSMTALHMTFDVGIFANAGQYSRFNALSRDQTLPVNGAMSMIFPVRLTERHRRNRGKGKGLRNSLFFRFASTLTSE